ncbi:MAG: hypothetical protein NTU98_03860 [Bacteroidetes bacterium]|nr:hypothetical protein [Bacteroidota bacterium]
MKKSLTLYPLASLSSTDNTGARTRKHQHRKKMERNGVSPSEQVIRNLLSYSSALSVLTTRDTGFVHLVMN